MTVVWSRHAIFQEIWDRYERGENITLCAWCDRVKLGDEWLDVPRGAIEAIDARLTTSHSMCPDCFAAQLPVAG